MMGVLRVLIAMVSILESMVPRMGVNADRGSFESDKGRPAQVCLWEDKDGAS
jgi:hypothetical protein